MLKDERPTSRKDNERNASKSREERKRNCFLKLRGANLIQDVSCLLSRRLLPYLSTLQTDNTGSTADPVTPSGNASLPSSAACCAQVYHALQFHAAPVLSCGERVGGRRGGGEGGVGSVHNWFSTLSVPKDCYFLQVTYCGGGLYMSTAGASSFPITFKAST